MAALAEIRQHGEREVAVLVGIVRPKAKNELTFDEASRRQFTRNLHQFVASEMSRAERDGTKSLGVDGEPLHLDLSLHVFGDRDDCVCTRGALAKCLPMNQPLLGVLVVRAVPICDEIEDRHDDAISNASPQVH